MPQNATETVIAGSGNPYIAPVGTAFPTNFAAPAGTWIDLGFLTEDGITVTPSQAVANIMAWQAQLPVRTSITSRGLSVGMTFLQWNETIFPLAVGGGTVTGAGPYVFTPPTSGTVDERAMFIHYVDGTKQYRLRLPRVMVTDLGAFNLNKANAAGLGVAFTVLQPATGTPYDLVTDDPAWA